MNCLFVFFIGYRHFAFFFQVIQGTVKTAEKKPDIGWFLDLVFKLNGLVLGRRNDRMNNRYNIHMDFLETTQVKKAAAAAKAKARAEFQKRFPNADIRQFTTDVVFEEKHNETGEVD